jgi:hypothetical protein
MIFLMHQLISTAGIGVFVVFAAAASLETLRTIRWQYLEYAWYQIFAYRPYFPVQILAGFYLGWLIARRFGHRVMIWVWIIPAAILCYAVVAVPTLAPNMISPILWSGGGESWLTHYFGWGCSMRDGCFDQVLVTQPSYTAIAYSIGALLAFASETSRPTML